MKKFFKDWLDNWPDPYPQRYRKNISYKWVEQDGALLMTLTSGEVTFPEPTKTDEPRASAGAAGLLGQPLHAKHPLYSRVITGRNALSYRAACTAHTPLGHAVTLGRARARSPRFPRGRRRLA
jgi:hypothetical protein